jgi:phosphatidylglycerophosphatase GEP4
VFDKDNTLSRPFDLTVEPKLSASWAACKAAFDGRLILYSNSAGLAQYDPEGEGWILPCARRTAVPGPSIACA